MVTENGIKVTVDDKGKDIVLNVSQIVWFGAKEEGLKQSGTFDINSSFPTNSSIVFGRYFSLQSKCSMLKIYLKVV